MSLRAWRNAISNLPPSLHGPSGAAPIKPPHKRPTSSRNCNCSASVMGLRASSPSSEYRVAGFMLPSVVDTRPPHHAVKERPAGQSKKRGAPRRASTALLPASLVPASRRRDLAGQGRTCRPVLPETQCALMSSYAATGASLPQRNSVPSIHMRWSTLPSLRASATFARFRPRRLATSIAQRLSVEKRVGRLSTALAAS